MPWHPRKRDPWYAIRTRTGPRGIVYRVSLRRASQTVWQLFREREHGSACNALEAARQRATAWPANSSPKANWASASA